jgi:DNA-directed RNA polymerase specialized sigma24 family protein
VRLRVFAGLTEDETAEVLGCSSETVTKEFRKAKAKLASYARRAAGSGNGSGTIGVGETKIFRL